MTSRTALLCLVLGLFAATSRDALAFLPVADSHGRLEIPLEAYDLQGYRDAATEEGRVRAAAAMSALHGGNWHVYSWNPVTRTPAWMYGSGYEVAAASGDDAAVAAAAQAALAQNRSVLGLDPAELRLEDIRRGRGQIGVHFQQTYRGIDVWRGGARLVFHESGRLFVLGSEFYRDIALDPVPRLRAGAAERIAADDLPFDPSIDFVEDGTSLLIVPVPTSPTTAEPRLVWRVRVHTEEPIGIWVTHVDAHTGEIVWRYNDIHFADFQGSADGVVQPNTWCDGEAGAPFRHMQVRIDGLGTVTTDGNGNWMWANGGETPRTVSAELLGTYVNVNVNGGVDAEITGVATPGVPFDFSWTDANARQDERDVYEAVSDVIELFDVVDPAFVAATGRIQANVNVPGSCNAYWSGSINFYPEVGNCANTGEIQGVVYHEYGHGVQHRVLGWQGDEGLGEGNSDVLANILTQEALIARGFFVGGCDRGIRNSKNSLIYPDDVVGQGAHAAGQVIAGFHWDALEIFQQILGPEEGTFENADLWHFGRWVYKPDTQPEQVLATFLIDDNDGNLDNGTPNWDVLCQAASNHGFECPPVTVGVFIEHDQVWHTDEQGDRELVAQVWSTAASLDSVLVVYRINGGGFESVAMDATGNPDEFAGVVPDLQSPATVEYYIRGVDAVGYSRNHPALAPHVLSSFDVALEYDPLEAASGWTVNLEGTDTATGGIWERVDPNATLIQPEDDTTPDPGTHCWITGQASVGGIPNDGDVDDGETSLYSPVYSMSGASQAVLKYMKWFHNSRGNFPDQDPWRVYGRNDGGAWVEIENTLATSAGWEPFEVDLLALFAEPLGDVQFKFVAIDWLDPSLVDAAIDDFELLGSLDPSDVGTGEEGGALRFALHGSSPNPMAHEAEIRFQVPAESEVELAIFDVTGRKVRALAKASFAAGLHSVVWNGRDEMGRPVGSGAYFLRMRAPGFEVTRSMVLTR